ncbi:NGG1 interacting factor 3-like protein [Leptomonas pyrrhocoris]|uniref:NGG1 interacting factor 3-like protein n=1 Tax=Leptomonas pyrrhocoris TaxID=157538 RepID=A0A0M9FVM9_LEPPY|nr:NGG1 interacting factor 3-like protein [Leptomonas pyrrhocoris]KPA76899.1 NGG1 interacting factor 3-like protein [Leptomonas pyrrhocoris]|eukprot:XP_015655338.1 NGG1 interacting factor 3-like protein [Leptomonas pyrrhocoris]
MSLLQRVVQAMQEVAPLSLADQSWDNVGVLLESPAPNKKNVVMLTIDLTPAVMEECVRKGVEVILAYHPPIFRPMKRLVLQDPKQRVLLEATMAGMSVYSPHTSLDAAEGGINDWLASLVAGSGKYTAAPIQPTAAYAPHAKEQTESTGMGRVVLLEEEIELTALVQSLKRQLDLPTLRVALPDEWKPSHKVSSVALCAGSGSGVFRSLRRRVDVLLTGEMGHHEVQAANAARQAVILCEHTNTERGFLKSVLQKALESMLEGTTVLVAEADHDPLVAW